MSQPSSLLATMIEAARAAGAGLARDFAALPTLTVQKKDVADFFSEADLKAEQTVLGHLMAARPEYGFLGEEGGLREGRDKDHVWIVDPLDGTTNFLTGVPIFAVNIALAREGRVIAGVTYNPVMDELYWAEKGGGAFLNGAPISVSSRPAMNEAILAVGIPFAPKPEHGRFRREMELLTKKVAGIRRLGAGAIDLAWGACGRFDAYWEQKVSAWDMAAGAILVEEAGGIVSDTHGRPLDLHNGTVLACAPQIREELLAALIEAAPAAA